MTLFKLCVSVSDTVGPLLRSFQWRVSGVSGSGVNFLRLWVLFYCLCCYYLFVIVELFVMRQDCKVSENATGKAVALCV
jgi:hypothetical protein